MDMRSSFTIPLTQDQAAVVDERDWYELMRYRWCAHWDPNRQSFTALRGIPHPDGGKRDNWRGKRRADEHMHRRIMCLAHRDAREVDHINHDTLDNRRKNLRIVTTRKNQENRRNQSRYGVGVYKLGSGRFAARTRIGKKQHYLGCFDCPEEAQAARREFLLRSGAE